MARHVVSQGEYLPEIARKLGFVDWKAIYDHPSNAALWERGRSEDLLFPGDVLEIPAKRPKVTTRKTGASHEFKLKKVENRLLLILKDEDGEPLKNEPFTLRIQVSTTLPDEQGLEIKKNTTGTGGIDEPLPPGALRGYLVLDNKPWLSFRLLLGHLDPIHDPKSKKILVTGVQGRLNNLGYRSGAVDGILGPKTKAAIARFQRKVMKRDGGRANGDLDDETRSALLGEHGC